MSTTPAGSPGSEDDVEPADRISAAVRSVDGVSDLHGGLFGEVGTYLPHRLVRGIRVGPDGSADIHVVVRWGVSVPDTADEVRRVVSALVPGEVHVTVADVATEAAAEPDNSRRTKR